MLIILVVAFFLVWVGAALIVGDLQHRHRRPTLTERLEPFGRRWMADDAQDWLKRRG